MTLLPWKHLYDMIKTDYSMNAAESNVHQNTSWFNKSLHLSSRRHDKSNPQLSDKISDPYLISFTKDPLL